MFALARNLGEKPIAYFDAFLDNDDGTVGLARVWDGQRLSKLPFAADGVEPKPDEYEKTYPLFEWSTKNDVGGWERATKSGNLVAFKSNGVAFGYIWFAV
jgi:hypothetical protein